MTQYPTGREVGLRSGKDARDSEVISPGLLLTPSCSIFALNITKRLGMIPLHNKCRITVVATPVCEEHHPKPGTKPAALSRKQPPLMVHYIAAHYIVARLLRDQTNVLSIG